MADASQIEVNNQVLDVKDVVARQALALKADKSELGGIQVRPDYIVSTVDLEDGVSPLDPGKLYFYYEA